MNEKTLQSYELGINDYVARTPAEVSGEIKSWIDRTLKGLSPNARIIEIGSAFGRDANYIESLGYSVDRTDAAVGFVSLQEQNGHSARLFNILTDDFQSKYDLLFANCVFLHFTPQEFQTVLKKIHASLESKGILSFSLKNGTGEEWTTEKVGHPRYFCYWEEDRLRSLLELIGFNVMEITQDQKFLRVIAQV